MRRGQLGDRFEGVGVKRLSGVDAEPRRSNQHEIGTTRKMRREFLGEENHQRFEAIYIWLGEEQDGFRVEGYATHYDTRAKHPHRPPEWRLYYPTNSVTKAMGEGDSLFLAKTKNNLLYFIVSQRGSTSERQLLWLFGLQPQGSLFRSRDFVEDNPDLDFAARFILDEIGIELEEPEADRLDSIIEKFGTRFPPTKEFSNLARATLPSVRAEDDPDAALLAWLDNEEALFQRLERRVVAARLEAGFMGDNGLDIAGFRAFSLAFQNRRKSRMGRALENHLEAAFKACGVRHVRGAVTENGHRPDFLFPGIDAYRAAPRTGDSRLTMLGAKSTCKDRWRQVLVEAAKIPRKHLLTLEPGISERQTTQMQSKNLQLIVPKPNHDSYTEAQRAWLWTFDGFISDVRRKQR